MFLAPLVIEMNKTPSLPQEPHVSQVEIQQLTSKCCNMIDAKIEIKSAGRAKKQCLTQLKV